MNLDNINITIDINSNTGETSFFINGVLTNYTEKELCHLLLSSNLKPHILEAFDEAIFRIIANSDDSVLKIKEINIDETTDDFFKRISNLDKRLDREMINLLIAISKNRFPTKNEFKACRKFIKYLVYLDYDLYELNSSYIDRLNVILSLYSQLLNSDIITKILFFDEIFSENKNEVYRF